MAPTHEVATNLRSQLATFKVMYGSALTSELRWAVLKAYVVRVDLQSTGRRLVLQFNRRHRHYGAAVDDTLHQRMAEQQQQQPGDTQGVMIATPRRRMAMSLRRRHASICRTPWRWMALLYPAPWTSPWTRHRVTNR